MRTMLALAVCAGLAACMSSEETSSVEAAVAQFHRAQARGDDNAIYAAAAPELRNVSRVEDLARLTAAVRNVSGCAAPARDPMNWNNNINTSGHFISVVYHRQCANGAIDESFSFKIVGGAALLVSYDVSGMALFPAAPAPSPPAAPAAPAAPPPAPQET